MFQNGLKQDMSRCAFPIAIASNVNQR
uniref:Uncharacterized protein n=1 Tax=Arundo donax TaxID=35708 RepID=A0A0A9GX81_ARUDO